MKQYLFLLWLGGLTSCHQAGPTDKITSVNPLLGHWQCDSIAGVNLDSRGRTLGEPRLEGTNFALDVTPTRLAITVGAISGDTVFSTYTRHGQELTTTFIRTSKKAPGASGIVEQARIVTLTPTLFRMEKTFLPHTGPFRIRYFYHR